MNLIYFEIQKIVYKRISLILLLVTAISFPWIIKAVSQISVLEENIPEGLFVERVAFAVIAYFQLPFLLPIWIIIFTGLELSNGHVNRVVFARSREYYFSAKLVYCIIITIIFSCIGLVAFLFTVKTSPFQELVVASEVYWNFFLQLVFSTFGYSILLLGITFIFRSPVISILVYFGWVFVEGIIFLFVRSRYGVEIKWLPFNLIRTFYVRNGEVATKNFYNPFVENIVATIMPIGLILLVIFVGYSIFSKSNLKPLSD